jgi:DGQHR domain-containing protein
VGQPKVVRRRALRIIQAEGHPLYMFALRPDELFEIADIARVGRDEGGELLGYQRPEVRRHVQNIVSYLDGNGGNVLFPNALILALSSKARFVAVRGPRIDDGEVGEAGTIEIPIPSGSQAKPAWVVDGQQRAMALSRSKRRDLPVPISAFVADDLETQREQFVRVNSTKPLPRGLLSELLPRIGSNISPTLAAKRAPAALCEMLNADADSPFAGLIKRSSLTAKQKKLALVSDTALIRVLEESFGSPSGCLFTYRNLATGETDFESVRKILIAYWSGVRDTWPQAWGKSPQSSRLMHSVGLLALGRLMDRVMGSMDASDPKLAAKAKKALMPLREHCCWTSGTWPELGLKWNELQNVPSHLKHLTSYLLRLHLRGASE